MTETRAATKAMNPSIKLGAIVGTIAGTGLGCAYGVVPHIPKLNIGPVPGAVVGLIFGGAFGLILGAYCGATGRALLSRGGILGFVIALAVFTLGRFADDTGDLTDKAMDILVGGTAWSVLGALVGASLMQGESDKSPK